MPAMSLPVRQSPDEADRRYATPLAVMSPQQSLPDSVAAVPGLYRDRAFWGMNATQFLGAFNDNLFKQLMLLLSLSVGAAAGSQVAAAAGSGAAQDSQGLAMLVFSTPFLLFSGLAGFLSDRVGKRRVVVASKVAEVVIMALGMSAFAYSGLFGYSGLLVVLFLMGTQSAFFGPAKYGILPEMLRGRDLPQANGLFLMMSFLAIILGTAVAGFLSKLFRDELWIASAFCIAIAVIGTFTSLLLRKVKPAQPDLVFHPSALAMTADMRQFLWKDRRILHALLVTSIFWMIAGIVQMAVNALGKLQLGLGDDMTSLLAATIGVGIALGCATAGFLSRGKANFLLVRCGAAGIVLCLLLLGSYRGGEHLLGFWGSIPVLMTLGIFTGFFAVPMQVFLQATAPEGQKGRIIGVMNQINWTGIVLSGGIYWAAGTAFRQLGAPPCTMFLLTAVMMLPVAIFYHPRSEAL